MTRGRQKLGEAGEAVAAAHLEARGYNILARRWRAVGREIDLVAENAGVVALVEVKTRRVGGLAPPVTAVDWRKRRQVRAAARAAVARWGWPGATFRFDVMTVEWDRNGPRVEHVEDAFRD